MGRAQVFVALALAVFAGNDTAAAVTYKYENIDLPSSTEDQARGINNNGQIVGFADALSGAIFGNGPHQTTSYSGDQTIPFKINDHGTIVGFHVNFAESNALGITGVAHGFVQINGYLLGFDDPATPPANMSTQTEATGINNDSLIVGTYNFVGFDQSTWQSHGFVVGLTSAFPFTTIDYLGDPTYIVDINDSGTALGYALQETPQGGISQRTFLYDVNTKKFGLLANTTGDFPTGMNNKFQFVGYRKSPLGMPWSGYLCSYNNVLNFGTYKVYLPPTVVDIVYPGAADTYPSDVNDDGVIVGWYDVDPYDSNYAVHAFRATPLP